MPKLKGKTVRQARTALVAKHCRLGAIKTAFNGKVKRGLVFWQSKAVGSRLPANSRVTVKVSKGARK